MKVDELAYRFIPQKTSARMAAGPFLVDKAFPFPKMSRCMFESTTCSRQLSVKEQFFQNSVPCNVRVNRCSYPEMTWFQPNIEVTIDPTWWFVDIDVFDILGMAISVLLKQPSDKGVRGGLASG